MALFLLAQQNGFIDVKKFIDPAKEVPDAETAWAGARDIVAETISENAELRKELRGLFQRKAVLAAKVVKSKAEAKPEDAAVFRDYFDYAEPAAKVPSHRALAVNRGHEQGFLSLQLRPDKTDALYLVSRMTVKNRNFTYFAHLQEALEDAYTRLLQPSLETEAENLLKQRADAEAIAVFRR